MELKTISDPLGDATKVTIGLPRNESGHFKPRDALAALHKAGLDSVSAVFIDEPGGLRSRHRRCQRVEGYCVGNCELTAPLMTSR